MRRTALDQLPQLMNVLRGDLSLVGPPPISQATAEMLDEASPNRPDLTPGLTGPWQLRAGDRTFEQFVDDERQYAAGWSVWRDVKLMLATIGAVFRAPRA